MAICRKMRCISSIRRPIIYFLEAHPKFGSLRKPLFDAHGTGHLRFANTTITIAEVLTGPLRAAHQAFVRRYREALESWQPIAFDVDIAESAARLRVSLRRKAGLCHSSGKRIID